MTKLNLAALLTTMTLAACSASAGSYPASPPGPIPPPSYPAPEPVPPMAPYPSLNEEQPPSYQSPSAEPYRQDEYQYQRMPQADPPAAPSHAAPVQLHRGAAMFRTQEQLKRLGYYEGKIDGAYGPQTRDAVVRFQQHEGLNVTGKVDQHTSAALGRAADNATH